MRECCADFTFEDPEVSKIKNLLIDSAPGLVLAAVGTGIVYFGDTQASYFGREASRAGAPQINTFSYGAYMEIYEGLSKVVGTAGRFLQVLGGLYLLHGVFYGFGENEDYTTPQLESSLKD